MITMNTDRLVADYLHRLDAAAAELPVDQRAELVAEVRGHIDDAMQAAGRSDEVTVRNVLERLGPPEAIAREAVGAAVQAHDGNRRTDGRDIAAFVVLIAGLLIAWLKVISGFGEEVGLPDGSRIPVIDPIQIAALAVWTFAAGYVAWQLATRAPRASRAGGLEISAIVLLTAGGFLWLGWSWIAGYVLVVLSDVWNQRDKIAVVVFVLPFAALAWIGGFPDPDVRLQEAARFGVAAGGLASGAYLARRLFRPSVARRQAGYAGDAG